MSNQVICETVESPFADLPCSPAEHFKLYFYWAVWHVITQVTLALGSRETAFQQFPFLAGYNDELAARGLGALSPEISTHWWTEAIDQWERNIAQHLPLRGLREGAGLDHETLMLLAGIGLVEEDLRFGSLFDILQGTPSHQRPTVGLLEAWWRNSFAEASVRSVIRRLTELGLVHVVNPDAPRLAWILQPAALLWDAIRGDSQEKLCPWAGYFPPAKLATLETLILPPALRTAVAAIPSLLESGEAQALIIRGPQRNGRRTLLGAVAKALDRGLLEINGLKAGDERWKLIGPLATLLDAMPAIVFDLAAAETADVPRLIGYAGPVGLVLGRLGGVTGLGVERALSITVDMPEINLRRELWERRINPHANGELETISERFRLTSGNIGRAASLAQTYAALEGRKDIKRADVQKASRALSRQALETLAVRVAAEGDWSHLAVGVETLRELHNLESRCRHRERLRASVGVAFGAELNPGVRALFTGPSGTGKTLAARLLASELQMDLYRLDLSAVVNKYIGETEKNLSQIFARAEELDIILLLDEGDALLTQRTQVQTANDRYANLETNYLLQRLESYTGIFIVTTNAMDRIDNAFQRRMDVVVEFRPPNAEERWAIWQLHLPAAHAIDHALFQEVVSRCHLTGGQIRNAALHASLLALNGAGDVTSEHFEAALRREYRKAGAVYPLRASI
jgi:hypothetical protein